MNEDELRQLLSAGLGDCDIELQTDGNKLLLRLVGEVFDGLSRVKRQQLVYGLLNEKISSGEIHAVSMTCVGREESK